MTPSIIEFPQGLIGIPGRRYALREGDAPFFVLEGIDDPSLSMRLANPFRFVEDYTVEVSEQEAARLPTPDLSEASLYATVRHNPELGRQVLNLRAPIVIIGREGYQVINEALDAPLRAPIGGWLG